MVNSEEIVERTFYVSLLNVMLKMGVTINPDDYLPLSPENEKKFHEAQDALDKFIFLFGIGNNQVRGAKVVPRITLELNGYFPGDIGSPRYEINGNTVENPYQIVEYPWEAKDISIDVHLVAQTQQDMRLLHNILYTALPAKGYLLPYFDNDFDKWRNTKLPPSGNLFIEISNYFDHPDLDHGLLEKVYTYTCKDGILPEILHPDDPDFILTPIRDISVLIRPEETNEAASVELHLPQ